MIFGREPALIIGLWGAVLMVATTFGLNLTETQQAGLNGLVIALCAFWIRQKVSPIDPSSGKLIKDPPPNK